MYLAYTFLVSPDDAVERDDVLPPGGGTFVERITAMNDRSVALFGREERAQVPGFLAERGETFLRVTEGLAPDTPVPAPWYGEVPFALATVTGLMLSETSSTAWTSRVVPASRGTSARTRPASSWASRCRR
ncbi:hypothetical protein [Streptomyces sp. NPDC086838]|uniref:hypothetical protein n=1 Tax=Streptomyces sp. NPDC086838 TaxID=3365762 RepID=UPI00381F3C1A